MNSQMTEPADNTANDRGRSQANRERLANAAAALFWTNGYAGTSLADIARQSGVPVGNIYYYFKTKAAIAEAVGEILRDQMGEALETIAVEEKKPGRRLVALFRLFAAANMARTRTGCPIAAACRSFAQEAPEAANIAARAFMLAERWIADNLVAAGQAEKDAAEKAGLWLAQWQGGIALAHALKDQARLDRVTDGLIAEAAALIDA